MNANASGIEMKYAQTESQIRQQFQQKYEDLRTQQETAVRRLAQARNECNMGNASSCQMIPSLKSEVDNYDKERDRLSEEEQRMLGELVEQKKREIQQSQPVFLGVTDWGEVGMNGPDWGIT